MKRPFRLLFLFAMMAVSLAGCVGPVSLLPKVELLSITPATGRLAGGTAVTIRGRNFAQLQGDAAGHLQDLRVLVCGVPLQSLQLKALEQRTVMLPPASHMTISLGNEITGVVGPDAAAGSSDVVVIQPDGGRMVLETSFECVESQAFAVAKAEPTIGPAPLTVEFDGSGSNSATGAITTYEWDFGYGMVSEEVSPSHTFTDIGTHVVTLTVVDDAGATDETSIEITVQNPAPVAVISTDPTSGGGVAPLTVTLDASASRDARGGALAYSWTVDDAVVAETAVAAHTFARSGTYVIGLTVTDAHGAIASEMTDYVVGNAAPVARFSTDPDLTSGSGPLTVTFDASTSADPDGSIVRYEWTLGNDATATGASVSHTFQRGTHDITLTVTDDEGLSSSATGQVQVDNSAPVPLLDVDPASGTAVAPVRVNLDASRSSDADDDDLTYVWTVDDVMIAETAVTAHVFTRSGSYVIGMTVTDPHGAAVTKTMDYVVGNAPPVARFSTDPDPASGSGPLIVTFDASPSGDPDGSIVRFDWTVEDGTSATGLTFSHTFLPGTHNVTLTVTDDEGLTATVSGQVLVDNSAPVAVLRTDPTPPIGNSPLTVQFDASGSMDPDGSIVGYEWDFGDGATSVEKIVSHTFTAVGTHNVTLSVEDDGGATNQTSVVVTVHNTPPVAVLEVDPASGTAPAPLQVNLNAAGSSDAEGDELSYSWSVNDVVIADTASAVHTFQRSGNYTIELTVTDVHGADSTEAIAYVVGNAVPLAMIVTMPEPATGTAPLTVQFDASGSSDPDGSIEEFNWYFGDGATSSAITSSHTFARSGTYTVKLTVTDDEATVGEAELLVLVSNAPPAAKFVHDLDPLTNTAPRTVTFDASGSSDPDGSITGYAWDFGDGGSATGVSPSYTFAKGGDHLVTLTVTDDEGAHNVTTQLLAIASAAPRAVATIVGTDGYQVTFSGAESGDSDGTIQEYTWEFGDGTSGTGEQVTHTYNQSGTFTVNLTVTDDEGLTGTTTVQAAPVNLPPTAVIREFSSDTDEYGWSEVWLWSDSFDEPGGSISRHVWEYEGSELEGRDYWGYLNGPGPHEITLTVWDNEGASDSAAFVLAVPTVLQVDIVETTLYLDPDDTRQLTANVSTIGGATEEVTWSSSDPGIVSVDDAGRISVHGRGHVIITAKSKHVSSSPEDWRLRDTMLVASAGPVPEVISLGTAHREVIQDVAVDASGNIYLTGTVSGGDPASGFPDAEMEDMLLIKLDPLGNELWRRSFGTENNDQAHSLAVNQVTGAITLVGRSEGHIGGDPHVGAADAVIVNVAADGNVHWTRQFGTPGSDVAAAVVLDSAGNVYTTGTLNESSRDCTQGCSVAFMSKHSPTGDLLWYKTLGSGNRNAMGVGLALDHSGDVVVTGMHEGYLGQLAGPVDAFILTLDGTTGMELSLHLFGTHQTDRAETVVVEQDGRYLWLGGDNSGAEPTYIDTRVRRLDANSGAISLDRHYYPTGLDRHVAGDLIPLGSHEYAMGGMRWTLARIFVSGHAGADFNENWYQEYQGSAWGTTLSGMVVAPDGRIIVAGHALNDGDGRGAANTDPFLLFFQP